MKNEARQIEIVMPLRISEFRVSGKASLDGQETVALHMKNISDAKDVVVTRIVHQTIVPRITGFPNEENYFFISKGRQYQEGGDLVTPININDDRPAAVTCYENNPILTEASPEQELDRWYTQAVGDRNVWDDGLTLKPQETLSLSYQSGQGGGIIQTRVSFGN